MAKKETASDRLDSRLTVVAIGAIIFYALCIREFTKRHHYLFALR
jgi:hypothetical protein